MPLVIVRSLDLLSYYSIKDSLKVSIKISHFVKRMSLTQPADL
jgi:hypothetical protein